ncbi:MAG: hypothetical protein H0V66_14840 [Bdellovibrionales bacterium]|nr:hypothetical protein [Bdellovibrionales bacterium]
MKTFIAAVVMCSLTPAFAAGYLKDFDYQLTDIASKGLTKESLFNKTKTDFMDLEKSICANRAHVWGYDLFRFNKINTGKIFIFFGASIWTKSDKHGYMYHVAPYIVENGTEYVMESSYPSEMKTPVTVEEWIESETYNRVKGSDCLEITAEDTDLTEYFYARQTLPEKRANGKPGARCYIRKVPGHYWFPTSIALHDLKKDADGKKVDYNPQTFDVADVVEACIETASSKIGRFFGGASARTKCEKHLRR